MYDTITTLYKATDMKTPIFTMLGSVHSQEAHYGLLLDHTYEVIIWHSDRLG